MSQITTRSTGGGGGVSSVVGGHDINVTTAAGVATVNVNNAITLGDVSAIPANSDAVIATTGDINIVAGNLKLPNTNSAGTSGVIQFGGSRFVSNFGAANTFLGNLSGSLTITGASSTGIGANCLRLATSADANTCVGAQSCANLTTGTSNSALGVGAFQNTTTASQNVAVGYQALNACNSDGNVAVGYQAGLSLTTGLGNTYVGSSAGKLNVTGDQNLAIGNAALRDNKGGFNIAIGNGAGINYNGTESSNIAIGLATNGIAGESNTLRIGMSTAGGAGGLLKTFICGITGITVTGVNVLVGTLNQLGVATSSEKYKENIKDMGNDSSVLMQMRPVSFNYKKDELKAKQWGMIAEEVEKFAPELCHYNEDGSLMTLYYQHFVPMLVNELQKSNREIEKLKSRLEKLEGI